MQLTAYWMLAHVRTWKFYLMKTHPAIKRAVLCTLAGCLIFSLSSLAQVITISKKNAQLQDLLLDIYKQSGYYFYCNSELLSKAKKVNIAVKDAPLEDVLKICFKDQRLNYTIDNKVIVIKANTPLPPGQPQDQSNLKGRVFNERGEALTGATITVKGTGRSLLTNDNGEFFLPDVEIGAVLVISNIGYETRQVRIGSYDDLLIQLTLSVSSLDEVQIIGYGTTTKRLSTSSVSKLSSDVIEKQPVTNLLQALSGRAAGLQIVQTNGLPGSPVTVQIRGQNSIAAGNNPLYIVDGVPFTSVAVERIGGPNSNGSSVFGSPLNAISPADIESVEILKDADATAIYGSRGSSGVILITTKKGKAGKAAFGLNVNTGVGSAARKEKTLATADYLKIRRDALANSNQAINPANAPDLVTWDTTAYTNWQEKILGGRPKTTDATASFSGGNQQTTFLLSGSYHKESTLEQTDAGYRRGSIHFNTGYTSTNQKFSIATNSFFTSDNNKINGNQGTFLTALIAAPPNYPAYDSTGHLYWGAGLTNPLASLLSYYKTQTDNLNSNIVLRYNAFRGLNIRVSAGYNKIEVNQISATPIAAQNPSLNPTGSTLFANQYVRTFLLEPQITYTQVIGKGTLEALVGSTVQNNRTNGQTFNLSGYQSDLLLESLSFGTVAFKSGSTSEYKYLSAFGRVNYNWQNKYVLNINVRRDGSSRFGPGKQFGNFGSLGTAWLFSNENFIRKKVSWLSYGKIRANYGSTGNDGIGDYQYLSTYVNTANYGTANAIIPSRIANPDFHWEVNNKFELALEIGLLRDRILLTSVLYHNHSKNQLVGRPLPATSGFASFQSNLPAVVENKGFEFEANTVNVRRKLFSWTSSVNVTIPRNRLVSFPGLSTSSYAGIYVVGEPLSIIQRFHYTGPNAQTGVATFEDINKDGVITPLTSYNNQGGDFRIAGKLAPDLYGGLSNQIKYKNFEISVFLQYVRQQGYNLLRYYASTGLVNRWESYSGYWRFPGDQAALPKPFAASNISSIYFSYSDAFLSDASFLRLKNVSLSYNLPERWAARIRMKSLKVYALGQNLATISKYKGYDPEVQSPSDFAFLLPPVRSVSVGLSCSL